MHRRRRLVLPALAACSERQEVRKPLQQGADMIITYIVAKRELADRLGEALGANRSSKYRLMALVGPSYPIGAAVDPENTIDIITEKSVLPKSALAKEPTPWADFPTAKASRKIDLNASAPIPLRNALKNAVDAGAKFDFRTASEFGLVELSQILVPQDQFEKAMAAPRCAQALPDPRRCWCAASCTGRKCSRPATSSARSGRATGRERSPRATRRSAPAAPPGR